jgi:prephenate dehydrogenase
MEVGVYGLGRFGKFWATELAKQVTVKGYNRTPLNHGIEGVSIVSKEELFLCDTIVLCVSISSFKDVLSSIVPLLKPGTVVMDTCSVKVYPVQVMLNLLPPDVQILATHPMFGPDSGKHGVQNLPLVYSAVRCSGEQETQWRRVFREMGLKVLDMDCHQHDREAAYSQGVTHFVGRVLDELHLAPTELATLGYRNLMSIVEQTCNDPIQLFYDLQRYNPYAHDMRVRLNDALDAVLHVLDEHDTDYSELPRT